VGEGEVGAKCQKGPKLQLLDIFWYLHVGASIKKLPENVWFCIFVEVPSSNSISCYNSSLLECSPVEQEVVRSNHCQDISVSGALVEDGDDLGQVSQ